MRTRVVNQRLDEYTVDIMRPGPWGNPFVIGRDGDRDEVIQKHRRYILLRPKLVKRIREELQGEILGCCCKPLPCHGDTLAEIADGIEWTI